MTEIKDQTFLNAVVDIDEKRFVSCKFKGCIFRYKGGEWESNGRNTLDAMCTWKFEDAALRTVNLLQRIGLIPIPNPQASF